MPCCRAISDEFPDRCFDQIGRPSPGETAFDLLDAGDFSPGPDLLHSQHDLRKGRKRLPPGMQEYQIVVAKFRKRPFRANPENTSSDTRQASCSLCFCKIAILPLVVLHACLSDEKGSIREHAYRVGQVVMGLSFKRVADSKRRILGGRESVGLCKRWSNVATRIADYLGIVFKPEKQAFFELATKRLLDRRSCTHLEAGNPS